MASLIDGELLTIAEAAERLKVSKVTISRWIKQGRLPAHHVGPRAIRIRPDDLDRLIHPVENPERPRLRVRVGDRAYGDISEVPPKTRAVGVGSAVGGIARSDRQAPQRRSIAQFDRDYPRNAPPAL